jgi:uncharacterized protein involved in cysteine biosynthesis
MPPDSGSAVPRAALTPYFRRVLVRVLGVELVVLILLWILQARYTH